MTGLPMKSGESVPVWGMIDHGSRTVLQLEPVAKYNSLILLGKLLVAFGRNGLPKAVRSDNDAVFKTWTFRLMLRLLGVKQQFTALHSPWQNGRIERFWRTMKETLRTRPRRCCEGLRIIEEQMRFASVEAMSEVLKSFQDFYNFSRPHQALGGQTPAQVWHRQVEEMRDGESVEKQRTTTTTKTRRTPSKRLASERDASG
ncbi:MAG: transposase [Brachymonas sp.]|nr:transposase [Brachymonas sp.]